jgi:hypothetical protein
MTPIGRYRILFIATLLGMSSQLAATLDVLLDVGCYTPSFTCLYSSIIPHRFLQRKLLETVITPHR